MTMPALTMRLGSRTLLPGVPLIALAAVASGSWFRVRQNEVAYVTRFGQVANGRVGPLQPGLHFKSFADAAGTISIDTVKMPVSK